MPSFPLRRLRPWLLAVALATPLPAAAASLDSPASLFGRWQSLASAAWADFWSALGPGAGTRAEARIAAPPAASPLVRDVGCEIDPIGRGCRPIPVDGGCELDPIGRACRPIPVDVGCELDPVGRCSH